MTVRMLFLAEILKVKECLFRTPEFHAVNNSQHLIKLSLTVTTKQVNVCEKSLYGQNIANVGN